jgi:uncharacterized protein (DUF427 family)
VWEYPRPPRLDPTKRLVVVRLAGAIIARTRRSVRVLETSHPPTFYLPPEDVSLECLRPSSGSGSVCEWKGAATYYDVVVGGQRAARSAWTYLHPTADFGAITGHISFYPSVFECSVDGDVVEAQPGGFYGGWVTTDVVGPFKGGAGTWGW